MERVKLVQMNFLRENQCRCIFSELGKYPASAQMKDWQCCSIALIVGCFFGMNRKEEMKPVYIRQTSMLKFQDRLTAEVRR